MKFKDLGSNSRKLALLALGVFAFSVIFSRLFVRIDVTEDNAYTLSEGSLAIAAKLDSKTEAKLYFSKSMKEMPPMIKQYGKRIEDVLREYATASNGKLTVEVIDPRPDTEEEEWAAKYGVQGVPTGTGDQLYLGVAFISGQMEIAIPYLDPRKEEFLEYDLAEALVKLRSGDKPKLGILSGLPIEGGEQMEKWAIMESLENSFEVVTIKPDAINIPTGVKVVFLVHPKKLEEKTLYAIDQFVMNGGRLLVAVDPFSRVDAALSQSGGGAMIMSNQQDANSDLKKLFDAWDIEFTSNKVVGDTLRATAINTGSDRINYPVFMTLTDEDINSKHKITSQLRQFLYAEGGGFALKNGSSFSFEPLISTSEDSGETDAAMMKFQQPGDLAKNFKGNGKKAALAAIVTGKFKSAFASGAPSDADKGALVGEAKEDAVVIVIGDVDFMHDGNSVNKMRFGPQTIIQPRNDNLNFVINAAEYLGGNQDLISIRTSGQISRPFTKVLEIQKNAQKKWQDEEEKLSKKLTDVQRELAELQQGRTDGNRFQLTPEQQAKINKFRDDEQEIRKQRRIVRKNLREDIESLGHKLVLANLILTPAGVAGFGLYVFRSRSRREREEKSNG